MHGDFIEHTFSKYFEQGFLTGFENKTCMHNEKVQTDLNPLGKS